MTHPSTPSQQQQQRLPLQQPQPAQPAQGQRLQMGGLGAVPCLVQGRAACLWHSHPLATLRSMAQGRVLPHNHPHPMGHSHMEQRWQAEGGEGGQALATPHPLPLALRPASQRAAAAGGSQAAAQAAVQRQGVAEAREGQLVLQIWQPWPLRIPCGAQRSRSSTSSGAAEPPPPPQAPPEGARPHPRLLGRALLLVLPTTHPLAQAAFHQGQGQQGQGLQGQTKGQGGHQPATLPLPLPATRPPQPPTPTASQRRTAHQAPHIQAAVHRGHLGSTARGGQAVQARAQAAYPLPTACRPIRTPTPSRPLPLQATCHLVRRNRRRHPLHRP